MGEALVLSMMDRETGVGYLTLNRPDKKNALSVALIKELIQQIELMSAEDEIRCIVLEAQGDSFCSGRDLKNMRAKEGKRVRFHDQTGTAMGVVRALRAAPQITIAS